MQRSIKSSKFYLTHFLLWIGFAAYEQVTVLFTDTAQFSLWRVLVFYLLNAGVFYCNSEVLMPRFYTKRTSGSYASAVVLLLSTYALLRTELNQHGLAALGTAPISSTQMWMLALYRGAFFLFVSMGYWFAHQAVELATHKRRQEHQLRLAERNLSEANLAFLKSQINPHFLFNALNFLYAQVYPHSENAAKGILLLADTMRYALHENSSGKVMLVQEIQHLQNFVAIHQLRFNDQLYIDFEISGSTSFLMILPLALITFVENCFKHGELAEPADPLIIRLTVVQSQLTFYTRNKKRLGPKEKSSGIGLANTRKRLDLMYPERFILHVEDGSEHYTCTLRLEL